MRLPVATARNSLSPTRTRADAIDPSAAICLIELGERVMVNPRKGYTTARCGKRGANLLEGCCLECASLVKTAVFLG
jgi:hypothetical protein